MLIFLPLGKKTCLSSVKMAIEGPEVDMTPLLQENVSEFPVICFPSFCLMKKKDFT